MPIELKERVTQMHTLLSIVLLAAEAGKMIPAPSGLQEVDGLNRLL
jgi:hypothetical protein